MSSKRRQLRDGILSIFDRYGILCTYQGESTPEDEIADLAISILATKPRKKPQPQKRNREMYHIAQALSAVCVLDYKSNQGMLFAEAKRLVKAQPTPTPDLIRAHYSPGKTWYERDFRGKRGDPPKPSQVRLTWAQFVTDWKPQPTALKVTPMMDQRGLDKPNPLARR